MLHPLTMLQHLMPEKAYRYASPPEHPRHPLTTPHLPTTPPPPRQAKKVIDEELLKLQSLEPTSSEFNVTRSYLEWLTVPPRNTDSNA